MHDRRAAYGVQAIAHGHPTVARATLLHGSRDRASAGHHESARRALGPFPGGRPSSSKIAPHASVPPAVLAQLSAPTLNDVIARQPASHQPHAIPRMLRSLGLAAHTSLLATAQPPASTPSASDAAAAPEAAAAASLTKAATPPPVPTFEELRTEQNHAWAAQNVARGVAHARAGRNAEAVAAYKLAIELDPDHVDAYVARGAILGTWRAPACCAHAVTAGCAHAPAYCAHAVPADCAYAPACCAHAIFVAKGMSAWPAAPATRHPRLLGRRLGHVTGGARDRRKHVAAHLRSIGHASCCLPSAAFSSPSPRSPPPPPAANTKRYDAAMADFEKALHLCPNHANAHKYMRLTAAKLGRPVPPSPHAASCASPAG